MRYKETIKLFSVIGLLIFLRVFDFEDAEINKIKEVVYFTLYAILLVWCGVLCYKKEWKKSIKEIRV